jgi:hypothetical protein
MPDLLAGLFEQALCLGPRLFGILPNRSFASSASGKAILEPSRLTPPP